jgi:hypothetical protein
VERLPALVIHETDDNLAGALDTLDALDHAAGRPLPALLIHPGPAPATELRQPRRRLLARPYRPARLRALIDYLLGPGEEGDEAGNDGNGDA